MRGFEGVIARAALAVGGAAVLAAALAVAVDRPAGAQFVPTPITPPAARPAEKDATPAPKVVVGKAVRVGPVTVRKLAEGEKLKDVEEVRQADAARAAARKAVVAEKDAIRQQGAAPPRPAAPIAPVGDPAMAARVQQLRPILRDELNLLTAAGPTPEQRRAIALAGGRKLKEIARTPENNRPRVNLFGKRIIPNDPVKAVHDAVEAAAREALAPEQFDRLQAEARARADDRREAILMLIVAKIDRTLDLGRDQRDKILDGLRAAFDEATFPTLAGLATWGDNYLPVLPEGPIVAHLTPTQRTLWADSQKLDFRSFARMDDQEEPPGGRADPDLEAALAEDPKP